MNESRAAIADQVLAALGGKKGDVQVPCRSCDRASYVVLANLVHGKSSTWVCVECGQRNETRLATFKSIEAYKGFDDRVQNKREEDEWES